MWGVEGPKWMNGIKEGTCLNEPCMFYVSDESLNSITEIIITLCVNLDLNNNKKVPLNMV